VGLHDLEFLSRQLAGLQEDVVGGLGRDEYRSSAPRTSALAVASAAGVLKVFHKPWDKEKMLKAVMERISRD
jgi:hypothetical protein